MSDQHARDRFVTARRAAELTGFNERTIRRMIARGDLPATKVSVNRYLINVDDLPPRKRNRTQELQAAVDELRGTLDTLKRDVDTLKRRVSTLENAKIAPDALRADSGGLALPPMSPYQYTPAPLPDVQRDATFHAFLETPARPDATGRIVRMTDASDFLERHGVNPLTPGGWRWLRQALRVGPITQDELLRRTQAHLRAVGYRAATVELHECAVADCPCHVELRS